MWGWVDGLFLLGKGGDLFKELLKCDRATAKAGSSHWLLRVSPGPQVQLFLLQSPPLHQHFLSTFRGDLSENTVCEGDMLQLQYKACSMETSHTTVTSLGHLSSSSISCDSEE